MTYTYKTKGTCSRQIEFELNDGIVSNVKFHGGCAGNTAGIAKIVDGMEATHIIERFEGVRCGFKSTSCPDQFAKALKEALSQE